MMSNTSPVAVILGGSGFLGGYVCKEMLQAGYRVQIVSRHPGRMEGIKTQGNVGDVVLSQGDATSLESLKHMVKQADVVINCIGVLFESGKTQRFEKIHTEGAKNGALLAKHLGAKRYIYVSALGVDEAQESSSYADSKFAGEKAAKKAFENTTIVRPSIIFGPEDNFFNRFAAMNTISPFLPLIGGGKTEFQPVYVQDVARAIALLADRDENETYELGGPMHYSFKKLLQFVGLSTNRKVRFMPIPFFLAKLQGTLLGMLPSPLLTRDQVELLYYDNVVKEKKYTLARLGIEGTSIYDVVPDYLARFKKQ